MTCRSKIAKIVRSEIQDGCHGRHLENLFFASSPEPKGELTPNLLRSIGVTHRPKIAKIVLIGNPRCHSGERTVARGPLVLLMPHKVPDNTIFTLNIGTPYHILSKKWLFQCWLLAERSLPHLNLALNKRYQVNSFLISPQKLYKMYKILISGMLLPFSAEVFICFFCESEFCNKEEMRAHQKTCIERPPELQKFLGSVSPNPRAQQEPPPISPKPALYTYTRLPLDKFIGKVKAT